MGKKEREPEKAVIECAKNLPVLDAVNDKTITTDTADDNILIEGDNYHALSVLCYTHKEKIDVIYIDPRITQATKTLCITTAMWTKRTNIAIVSG